MILYNLIPPLIDCAREAVNGPHLHLNNRVDGTENEVGYIKIERPSNPVGFDMSLSAFQSS